MENFLRKDNLWTGGGGDDLKDNLIVILCKPLIKSCICWYRETHKTVKMGKQLLVQTSWNVHSLCSVQCTVYSVQCTLHKQTFRVIHKELDCKDDRVDLKHDSRFNYVSCLKYSNIMAYLMIWQRKKHVYSCRESWI